MIKNKRSEIGEKDRFNIDLAALQRLRYEAGLIADTHDHDQVPSASDGLKPCNHEITIRSLDSRCLMTAQSRNRGTQLECGDRLDRPDNYIAQY